MRSGEEYYVSWSVQGPQGQPRRFSMKLSPRGQGLLFGIARSLPPAWGQPPATIDPAAIKMSVLATRENYSVGLAVQVNHE